MLKKLLNRNKQDTAHDFRQPETVDNGIAPEPLSEQVGNINVEAGVPLDLSAGGKNNMGKVAVLAVALVGVGIAVAGVIAFSGSSDEDEVAAKQQELEKVANTQQKDFSTEKLDFGQEQIAAASEPAAASQPEPDGSGQTVPAVETAETPAAAEPPPEQSAGGQPPAAEPQETPRERKLRGEVLIGDIKTADSGSETQGAFQAAALSDNGLENTEDREPASNSFAARLNPTATAGVQAQRRADSTYLLAKGTNIPCTLDTQIITTHAGITRCLVTKDVYSANGKVLLLERGTKITGEQTAALLQGQARVFVLWNEAETPNGVKVNLASGGAGKLGASGHEAWVQYHFWQRFGGAVMISLIGDLGDYYSNRSQGSGQNISFENSSEAAQQMATEALKNSINIPPTGTIHHGSLINVMVARDVDFGSVYEVVKPYSMF